MVSELYANGSIDMHEIQNVFVQAKTILDEKIWPTGGNPSKRHVIEFLDSLRHELYERCKKNAIKDQYKSREMKPLPADPQNQIEYEKGRSRMALNQSRFEP